MKKLLLALLPFLFTGCYMQQIDSGQGGVEVVAVKVSSDVKDKDFLVKMV